MMLVRAVHIEGHIYPTTMQDGGAEVAAIREFIKTIEEAAIRLLPRGRCSVKITEERQTEVR